jgi:cysteinyl-tRNA synthetase
VRFFLARVHYRTYIDYSEDSLKEARVMLERFYQALRGVEINDTVIENDFDARFVEAMDDDFNTPKAISVLFELVNELNKATREGTPDAGMLAAQLKRLGGILGLLQQDPAAFLKGEDKEGELSSNEIEALIQQRAEAKKAKNFAESDRIRDELSAQGVILKDTREGTTWFRES